jgi:hypothetical protein
MHRAPLLATLCAACWVAAAVSPAQKEFLRLLKAKDSVPGERKAAFAEVVEEKAEPSADLRREIGRAWEAALRDLTKKATSRAVFAEAQALLPVLAQTGSQFQGLVAGEKAAKEDLDKALADVAGRINPVAEKILASAEFEAASARLNEVGTYGAWARTIRGFTATLGETIADCALMRNFVQTKHHPILDFNEQMLIIVDPGEAECMVRTNLHRIRLGLRPLEIDLRLVAAGQKHAEEMGRLGYFSHDSPTPGRETPWVRASRDGVAASFENITQAGSAREAFDSWFYSAGHHRNMIAADAQAIGIGRSGGHWTELGGRASILLTYKKSKEIVYVRLRYEAADDAAKIFDLARYCVAQKLTTQAEDELERLLRMRPDHAEARALLATVRAKR